MKHILSIIVILTCCYSTLIFSQPVLSAQIPLSSSTSYIGNSVSNVTGGMRRGTSYLGLMNWKLEAKLEGFALPGAGTFHVNIASSHGGEPTANFVGDFQGVSNIEAGNHTFLYELYYRHEFSDMQFTVGLQDMNTEFANSEYAALFQNSSFGIHATIASETTSPIYPLTALGVVGSWNVTEQSTVKLGLFDGSPEDFQGNEHNINWCVCKDCGYMAIAELNHAAEYLGSLPGMVKIGGYFANSLKHEQIHPSLPAKDYGFYAVIEQTVMKNKNNDGSLSLFSQIAVAPQNTVHNRLYYSLGLHHTGIISSRPDDIAGIALASAVFREDNTAAETVIEGSYQAAVNEHFFVKPNVQYIINPAGTEASLANALVASVQFGFNF